MPLRDHFHSPWREQNHWEGFHSAWVNTMVRHLNGSALPPRFRAVPQVHLGAWIETDVAAFETNGNLNSDLAEQTSGSATAVWAPPQPVHTAIVEFPAQEIFEVRVYDERRNMRLVGVVELVSPGNKDRPENRSTFAAKCAGFLQKQVGLLLVDVVTDRHANLHEEILRVLSQEPPAEEFPDLYAVAYRTHQANRQWRLDTWPIPLEISRPLPILPLWLAGEMPIPLDLELTYAETCQVLRIS